MKVLVTGATGFIGGCLVERLVDEGHEVIAFARDRKKAERLLKMGTDLLIGDLTEPQTLEALASRQIDAVVHCAGERRSKRWTTLYDNNVKGTDVLCRWCLGHPVKKFIYLSSVAVISGNLILPLGEDLPYNAEGGYGRSKMEAEKRVLAFARQGLPAVVFRPCLVYGEQLTRPFDLIVRALRLRMVPLIDGGRRRWQLVYIGTVLDALMMALHHEGRLEGPFTIADEEALTVRDLFTIIAGATGSKVPYALPRWLTAVLLCVPFVAPKIRFFLKERTYETRKIKEAGFSVRFNTYSALKECAGHWSCSIR